MEAAAIKQKQSSFGNLVPEKLDLVPGMSLLLNEILFLQDSFEAGLSLYKEAKV